MKYFLSLLVVLMVNYNYAQWEQKGQKFEGEKTEDLAGYGVAMDSSGLVMAYSEVGYDNDQIKNVGRVIVRKYDQKKEMWYQMGNDLGVEVFGHEGSRFGSSVSINATGNTIALSAPYFGASNGVVFIYKWNENNLDWDMIIGGAPFSEDNGENKAGAVTVYKNQGLFLLNTPRMVMND